jgi:Holliday junction DNA helicase RuvA
MFNHLSGKVTELNPAYVVVDCNGVGYSVFISLTTYSKISGKEKITLLTHLKVSEDSQELFGFADEQERRLFRHLISVSGIGAKTAMTILSSSSPDIIMRAILSDNIRQLQTLKGVSEKTAQKIVIELKKKISKEDFPSLAMTGKIPSRDEALAALATLGFPRMASEKAIDTILNTNREKEIGVEELIKMALKNIR